MVQCSELNVSGKLMSQMSESHESAKWVSESSSGSGKRITQVNESIK